MKNKLYPRNKIYIDKRQRWVYVNLFDFHFVTTNKIRGISAHARDEREGGLVR